MFFSPPKIRPQAYVFMKVRPILEGLGHIRHKGNIQVTDVPVSVGCIRFVREPQIHRILKIGVGDRFVNHEFRPVVGPVWVGGESFVDALAFVALVWRD